MVATNERAGWGIVFDRSDSALKWNSSHFDPDLKQTIDEWPKGLQTNGIFCAISFLPDTNNILTAFYVNLVNTTTNFIPGHIYVSFEPSTKIELFDDQGKIVAKTAAGKKYGVWNDEQIRKWFTETIDKQNRLITRSHSIAGELFPASDLQIGHEVNILQLFDVKKPGFYTLHLQIPFVQNKKNSEGIYQLQIVWLPELIAKIHFDRSGSLSNRMRN